MTARRKRRHLWLLAILLTVLDGTPAAAQTAEGMEALRPPVGEKALFSLAARGVQIYTCRESTGPRRFAWTLRAPGATLYDDREVPQARHYAGPTWEAADGSRIVGELRAQADAPLPESLPWLLLAVRSHEGDGRFTPVTSIQRVDTLGGVAPDEGCDAAHQGTEVQVLYTARYVFYGP